MARFICKLDGLYFEWSTIVDAPVTGGMTRGEFVAYYRDVYGSDGMRGLPERMARVDAKGTSAFDDVDVYDTIALNRAGPGERSATEAEIVAMLKAPRGGEGG